MITTADTWIGLLPFARNYMWDLTISGFPGPMPCHQVGTSLMEFENGKVEYGPYGFTYPKKAGRGHLTISIYETDKYIVHTFFEEWFQVLRPNSWGTALLNDNNAAKEATLELQGIDGSVKKSYSLLVLPDGTFNYSLGSSHGETISIDVGLSIVGLQPN